MISSDKIYKTYAEQVELLKTRSLTIDCENAEEILMNENYYNLINGYNELFLDPTEEDEIYIEKSNFSEIYALYQFDREIRALFLKEILEIENNVKAIIANIFSAKYGHKDRDYLDARNFRYVKDATKSNEENSKANGEIHRLVHKLIGSIWGSSGTVQPYIRHYCEKHGYVPLWVLVNSMSFGDISKFYSYMRGVQQVEVCKIFGSKRRIEITDFEKILKSIGLFRNLLAHDERFYSFRKVNSSGRNVTMNFKGYLKVKTVDLSPFSLILILKLLDQTNNFNSFVGNFMSSLRKLESELSSVEMKLILKKMNFINFAINGENLDSVEKFLFS